MKKIIVLLLLLCSNYANAGFPGDIYQKQQLEFLRNIDEKLTVIQGRGSELVKTLKCNLPVTIENYQLKDKSLMEKSVYKCKRNFEAITNYRFTVTDEIIAADNESLTFRIK